MNSPRDWMPAERHKRSQNPGVLYTLVDEVMAVWDAFTALVLIAASCVVSFLVSFVIEQSGR
jgi:hypothetical protein